MRKIDPITLTRLSRTAAGSLLLCFVLVIGIVGLLLQPGSRHFKCSDFGSYADAYRAYKNGADYLDGGKKNGIPCESLL